MQTATLQAEARAAQASGAPAAARAAGGGPQRFAALTPRCTGATPGASVSDAQMAQRLGKHAPAGDGEAAEQPPAKRAKGGGGASASRAFLKPPPLQGGRAPTKG